MRRIYSIVTLVVAGIGVLWFLSYNFSLHGVSGLADSLWSDCVIFSHETTGERYYNKLTGLSFDYPVNTVICEKNDGNIMNKYQIVTSWEETSFKAGTPAPAAFQMYVDNQLREPEQTVTLSENTIMIGAVEAVRRSVRDAECQTCDSYTDIYVSHNGHNIELLLYSDPEFILNSLSFDR